MTVLSISDNHIRIESAQNTTGWVSDGGGGAGPQNEPDWIWNGAQGVSRKLGTGLAGFGHNADSA